MHVVNDIERIGDYWDNIAESAEIKNSKKLPFSDIALKEIAGAFEVVTDMVDKTIDALNNYDDTLAKQVLANEYIIDDLERDLRESHIERLNNGNCHPHSAITFVELIHSLERIDSTMIFGSNSVETAKKVMFIDSECSDIDIKMFLYFLKVRRINYRIENCIGTS